MIDIHHGMMTPRGIINVSPVNAKHLYNICTMLDQRRRRWADVVQMLYKYFVFAEKTIIFIMSTGVWYLEKWLNLNSLSWHCNIYIRQDFNENKVTEMCQWRSQRSTRSCRLISHGQWAGYCPWHLVGLIYVADMVTWVDVRFYFYRFAPDLPLWKRTRYKIQYSGSRYKTAENHLDLWWFKIIYFPSDVRQRVY